VLSRGEPRNAAVNFDTYRMLQRHRAFLCHCMTFLYTSVTIQMLKLHTVRWFSRPWRKAENHGTRPKIKKSRKSHDNHEYVIILQR